MKEYEYSFKTDNIEKYIDYCKKKNYQLIKKEKQTRTIYRNDNKTIARITITDKEKVLDFKEDDVTDEILKIRKETLPLKFDDINIVESILSFLNYRKDTILIRTRMVYQKENVKFELDSYESPDRYYVVAIEGDSKQVDKVYTK